MIDFPDELGIVTFTRGCNLRCPVCQNPSLVNLTHETASRPWSVDEIIVFAKDEWADGVCITGGEPTIHPDLPDAIEQIKKAGLKVKLDTNGTLPMMLKKLLDAELLDFVAMDVKAPMKLESLERVTGNFWKSAVTNLIDLLISSMAMIKRQAPKYHFRTVCFEKFLSPEDVGAIADMLKPENHYLLLPFDPRITLDPELTKEPASSYEYLRACLAEARKHIPTTKVYGLEELE